MKSTATWLADSFCRAVHTLSRLSFAFACICCLIMVLLTAQQVIARYFFQASSVALQELEWHLFGAMFLLGAPYTLHCNQHVRVDIVYARQRKSTQRRIDLCGTLFFLIPMCVVLVWYGTRFALQARGYTSPLPDDFYSAQFLGEHHVLFSSAAAVEQLARETILVGEGSPNPGGLEARWLVKALIPLSFLLLCLEALASMVLCRLFNPPSSRSHAIQQD